jgi:hypothetical protein
MRQRQAPQKRRIAKSTYHLIICIRLVRLVGTWPTVHGTAAFRQNLAVERTKTERRSKGAIDADIDERTETQRLRRSHWQLI